MKHMPLRRKQGGATLVVGLIMLVLITLMVVTALTMSASNLKSVGNMQFRNEAISAANAAIEQAISTSALFSAASDSTVTINGYSVTIKRPVCLYATPVVTNTSNDPTSNIYVEGGGAGGSTGFVDTFWDIEAQINDSTGARIFAHQGVKLTLPAAPNPCP